MLPLILAAAAALAPVPAAGPQFLIEMRVVSGDALAHDGGPKAATLTAPRLVATAGRAATVEVGRLARPIPAFRGTVTATPADAGRVELAVHLTLWDGPDADAASTVRASANLADGEAWRVHLGGRSPREQTWAEVTARLAP